MKVTLKFLIQLNKTKKAFLLFDVSNNKIERYIFTNDLTRYRHKYTTWKLTEIIKPNINKLTIEI